MPSSIIADYQAVASELLVNHPVLGGKISAATGLADGQVATMLREVLRFLHLIQSTDGPLTPPLQLDLAWHELILFTRVYASVCDSLFGGFIHHSPGGSEHENRFQLRRTLKLYALTFGTPDPIYWGEQGYYGEPADCGACQG